MMGLQSAVSANEVIAQLNNQRARDDVMGAVLAMYEARNTLGDGVGAPRHADLEAIFRQVEALSDFMDTEEGATLLTCYKRAAKILAGEQDRQRYQGKPNPRLYERKEERELAVSISVIRREAEWLLEQGDFVGAVHALASLPPLVIAFFDNVQFDGARTDRRDNRLRLLNEICAATSTLADFSKIEQ